MTSFTFDGKLTLSSFKYSYTAMILPKSVKVFGSIGVGIGVALYTILGWWDSDLVYIVTASGFVSQILPVLYNLFVVGVLFMQFLCYSWSSKHPIHIIIHIMGYEWIFFFSSM